MFRNIKEVTFKISPYCNLRCEYCFQKSEVKEDARVFNLCDELVNFLIKLPLDEALEFKVTGGESSLFCEEIEQAYKKLKKIERYKETKIRFTTITNGTNMKGIIDLMDRGILDPDGCKYSWDGIHSESKSRKVKDGIYDDYFFNSKLIELGESKYRDKVLVRTALTPNTVDDLANSLEFALSCGITKWEYYYLTDCEEYRDRAFVNKCRKEFEKITLLHNKYHFQYYNWETLYFTENVLDTKDRLRSVSCRHLGRSLYVDMDGNISPCGFFSDDCVFDECKLYIGNIKDGFYKNEVDTFIKEYNQVPMCSYETCENMHCFECPATNKHRMGHMKDRLCQTCALRTLEREIFLNKSTIKGNAERVRKMFNYTDNWSVNNSLPKLPYKE